MSNSQSPHTFLPQAFFEGQFIPFVDAKISVATHAFQYGTGAFGGLRGFVDSTTGRTKLFRLDRHADRLSRSAKYFGYDIEPEFIKSKILEFVQLNQPKSDFYIRPMIYSSSLGISPATHNVDKDFLIYGLSMGDYLNPKGVSCRFSSWIRQEDSSVPLRGKITGSYTMASMAKSEAVNSGFDEALIFNSKGKICEASAMNLFVVRSGQLITPSVDQDILEGITRDSIIILAKHLNIPVIERAVDKTEILIADEVFLTGTAGKITCVNRIENHILPESKPIFDQLKNALDQVYNQQISNFESWITIV